jgi:centromeric protein E
MADKTAIEKEVTELKRERALHDAAQSTPQKATCDVSLDFTPPPMPVPTATSVMDENIALRADLVKAREKLLLAEMCSEIPQGPYDAKVTAIGEALLKAIDEREAAVAKLQRVQEDLKEVVALRKEMKKLEEERDVARKQLIIAVEDAERAKQRAQAELKDEAMKLKRDAKDQHQRSKDAEQMATKLGEAKEKLRQALEEKTKLQGEKLALEKEAKMLVKQRDSLEREVEKQKGLSTSGKEPSGGQVPGLQRSVSVLQSKLTSTEAELAQSRSMAESLGVQLEEAQQRASEMAAVQKRISALEKECETLKQAAARATEKLAARERTAAETEQKLSQQLTELAFTLEEQTARAKAIEATSGKASAKTEEDLARLQSEAAELRKREASQTAATASLQLEVDAMREALQAESETKAKLEEEFAKLDRVSREREQQLTEQAHKIASDADYLERIQELEIQRDDLIEENL